MPIRLSILTVCYSRTPYFVEMLESFLQSGYHFRDTELVVFDNISPPGGDGDTAREYAKRYPDIVRVVRNDAVCGINHAVMQAFGTVRGKYLLSFDYDDVLVPFDFDADMDFLDSHEEYCGVYGIKRLFNAEEGDMRQCYGGDSSLFAAALDPRETCCGMIYRVSDIWESGGWLPSCLPDPPGDMPDVVLHLALNLRKRFCFRGQLRALYRRHAAQHTAIHGDAYRESYPRLRASLTEYFAPLCHGLLERRPMQIRPEERRPAVALLGSLLMRPGATPEEQLQYCAAAESLLPDDYGIREYRIRILLAQRNFTAALAEAFAMYAEHRESPYITQLALGLAEEAAGTAAPSVLPALRRCREAELARYFSFTPAQQELLDRTVTNFRTMMTSR